MGLREHIASDPDGRGYSGMNDAELAADLSVKRWAGERQITLKEFGDAVPTAVAGRVLKAMATYGSMPTDDAPLVQAWLDLLKSPEGTINIANAKVQGMLQAFEGAGLLQAGDAATCIALADNQLSDAQKYGLLSTIQDVQDARRPEAE